MRIILIPVFLFFAGCGVKTDPIPYVVAYPETPPKPDAKPAQPQETKAKPR